MIISKWLKFPKCRYKNKIFQNLFSIRIHSSSFPLVLVLVNNILVVLVGYRSFYLYKKKLIGLYVFFINTCAVILQVLPEYGRPLTSRFHVWTLRRGDPLISA